MNELEMLSIQQQLSELTSFVRQLAVGNSQEVKVCGICTNVGHSTDTCPMLQKDGEEQVKIAGGVPAPRRQYDPYSNTYNLGWRDHPNFSYGYRQQNSFPNRPLGFQQSYQPKSQPSFSSSSDANESISNYSQSFRSPGGWEITSQPEVNPKNVSTMTLKSGKEIEGPKLVILKDKNEDQIDKELEEEGMDKTTPEIISDSVIKARANPSPFPSRLEKPRKQENEKEILEVFRNIPLLDAIKQVPKYAKFLKDLCVNKRKLRGDERVVMGKNVSAVMQKKLPPKCANPGMFSISCRIENTKIRDAMLDLGASINVMPKNIYTYLNLGPLKETRIIIQLADRTNAYPDRLIKDVLVKVNDLVFPANFYVLDKYDEHSPNRSPLILRRPFLSTAETKIDVKRGTLTMEFDGEVVHFNIFDVMKYPPESHSVFAASVINPVVQEVFELNGRDELEVAFTKHLELEANYDVELSAELKHTIEALQSLAPVVELKPLPDHLRYAYLDEGKTLLVIISAKLSAVQEEKLIRVLQEHKEAIGWSIADIKGISPSLCMHRIRFEEDA
ncbi:uncharacterized protein LOC113766283 [Coffea eugenioides]|uniref:uncharacterized protein LOC113766283 n=1 Tax=Coffea eugenioides TaxID=49369 RepID=UPI000F6125EE|nr:uncharacterized protein LOC113766283 [Coffea eugenioides]